MNKLFSISIVFLFIFTSPIFSQVKNKNVKGKVKNEKVKILKNNKEPVKTIKYVAPQVHVEEVPNFIPSITQVETAIPAFIGYTEKGPKTPTQISSINDYLNIFGGPSNDEIGKFEIDTDGTITSPQYCLLPNTGCTICSKCSSPMQEKIVLSSLQVIIIKIQLRITKC